MLAMTLMEVTYQLQQALAPEQLRRLGLIANLYGIRRFWLDEQHNQIRIEYDGSRLREIDVAQALRAERIPVSKLA